jgi:hypothetical protein
MWPGPPLVLVTVAVYFIHFLSIPFSCFKFKLFWASDCIRFDARLNLINSSRALIDVKMEVQSNISETVYASNIRTGVMSDISA